MTGWGQETKPQTPHGERSEDSHLSPQKVGAQCNGNRKRADIGGDYPGQKSDSLAGKRRDLSADKDEVIS
jgi:hypothetical protein